MSRILFEHPKETEDRDTASFVQVTIQRYDPQKPQGTQSWQQTYNIVLDETISVFDLLQRIYAELDPTLAFRTQQCNQGICNVCRMKVNDKAVRACQTLVRPGESLMVKALHDDRRIRDLVIE